MNLDGDYNKYPKILVISNNAFSTVKNNGKTLDSFFDGYPFEKLAQLYFNGEEPNGVNCNKYYQITDRDVLISLSKKDIECGKVKSNKTYEAILQEEVFDNNSIVNRLKNYDIARIVRELIWKKSKWNNENLNKWLDEFRPELIFFCAGDSGFAYDITKYIKERYQTKLAVYVTDDYILPRNTISIAWWIRRNYILKKMKACIKESDLFITISDKMRSEYKRVFGKDSILAINMTESMKIEPLSKFNKSVENKIKLVYTGGLHYNRYKVLHLLAKSIEKYNNSPDNEVKACLEIYSSQIVNNKQLKYLNIDGASEYKGKLNFEEVRSVLNYCDIPVHVESFDRKSRESTRLSISTKIPEYLSLGKPILSIGPKDIASIEYLMDISLCITNPKDISRQLNVLLNSNEEKLKLGIKALEKYRQNHSKECTNSTLISKLNEIYIRKED